MTEEVKQLQLIITAQKGVALDYQAVGRDTKALSKELFTWGQREKDDVKDVSDRLAWINFVHGGLTTTLGQAIESSRAPLKAVRDAEENIFPRRNLRKGIHLQIQQIRAESKSSQAEKKIAELTAQLKKLEADDDSAERELEILKRNALRESEARKWQALREYSEKVLLLSQASELLLAELPSIPPHQGMPYNGTLKTASVRAGLQRALDNYKTGHFNLPPQDNAVDSDTRSFGETHASELSSIASASSVSVASGHSTTVTPPGTYALPPLAPQHASPLVSNQVHGSTPLDPSVLNNTPAVIPSVETRTESPQAIAAAASGASPVSVGPTVAETGVPLAAGNSGPGPSSGSLAGGRVTASPAGTLDTYVGGPAAVPLPSGSSSSTTYESAEEEKKRLEREERERVLRGESYGHQPPPDAGDAFPDASRTKEEEGGGPPPYQPY